MKKINLVFGVLACSLLFSCVPALKYEKLKTQQDACKEENTALKSQVQSLEEQNDELTNSTNRLKAEQKATQEEIAALTEAYKQMKINCDNINDTYQILVDKNKEILAGNKSATQTLMEQLQKSQEDLQAQEDALRALETSLLKKEESLNKLNIALAAREQRVNELETMIARKDSLVKALKDKVKEALLGFENNGLTIEQKNGKVYVSLDNSLLFTSGSYDVGTKGTEVLKKLAKVLEQNEDINIVVEGHTDNVPLKGKGDIRDNWDLSVKRATSVVKIITTSSKVDPKRLTAAGRSEYMPLDLSNTVDGRKKNRRIEIILTPDLDELFELLEAN